MPFFSQRDEKPTLGFDNDVEADADGADAPRSFELAPSASASVSQAALAGASRLGVAASLCVGLAVVADAIYCLAVGQLDRLPSMLGTAAMMVAAHFAIGGVGGAQAWVCDFTDRRTGLPAPGIAGREGYRIALLVGMSWFLAYRLSQMAFFLVFDWRELTALLSLSIGISLLGWMILGFLGASLDRMGIGVLKAFGRSQSPIAD